jgi:U4/U6 small nuclear ribonucleoprotein PRP31
MATLADELLNDFEDSGSEDGNRQNDFLGDEDGGEPNGHTFKDEPSDFQTKMELDDDEEEVEDAEEEEQAAQNDGRGLNDIPDEEETKAKVEKMNLGGVGDVRSVAVLMKTLQPVLEVIISLLSPEPLSQTSLAFTSLVKQT